jgi:hypothetical protein
VRVLEAEQTAVKEALRQVSDAQHLKVRLIVESKPTHRTLFWVHKRP